MQIEFLTSLATDRAAYRQGEIVTRPFLPAGWGRWLEAGLIRLLPDDATEVALVPDRSELAVPKHASGRAVRPAAVAGRHRRVSRHRAEPDA